MSLQQVSGRQATKLPVRQMGESSAHSEAKFSALEYAARFRKHEHAAANSFMQGAGSQDARKQVKAPSALAGEQHGVQASDAHRAGQYVRSQEEFREIVEDVRTYLVESRAQTEEDQIEYGAALNRAVLGFAREREAFLAIIQDRLAARRVHHLRPLSGPYATMAEAVFAEVIGLSVLESVLKDRSDLEEVQVVGTRIFEVRGGRSSPSAYRFRSIQDVERLQQNLVLFNRESITARKRWAEVSLPDGARVTMTGFGYTREPTITIRFFPVHAHRLDDLISDSYATLDEQTALLLRAIVAARRNIVIIGATNSGKSHLLKALIAEMPDEQRVVTIEQRCELFVGKLFPNKNVVEFEAPDDDRSHNGEQAFRLALRQSPERIILAEIRDQEANLYVRACTRGHAGSVTTVHVNTLEDVPDAITDMCMQDRRGMNPERLRRRIARYVTQIGIEMKLIQGKRKIVRISELSESDGEIEVNDLITYDFNTCRWLKRNSLSPSFQQQLQLLNPELYETLSQRGWISD